LIDGWNARYDPECITITPFDNQAAFQLSAMVKKDGFVSDGEVRRQARTDKGLPSETVFGQFKGLFVVYAEGDTVWRRYWIAKGSVLVFATYNGAPSSWEKHKGDVESMLATLEERGIDA
jgi:hypothetical protein